MAATADNILVQVQTYQKAMLAAQSNYGCFVSTANTRYKNFQNLTGNLGTSVSFSKPYRFKGVNSLVASFESIEQRQHTLVCDQPYSVAVPISAEQWVFTLDQFMTEIGLGCVQQVGSVVEANVAKNCVTETYRYYGDGVNPINQDTQIANMLAQFRNTGMPKKDTKCYLSDMTIPNLVDSQLSKFVPNRNEKSANSWDLGRFDECDFYKSNLLHLHIAGSVGNNADTLTVTSVARDANGAITSITFSGATSTSDPNAVKNYDKFTFQDGVSGQSNVRFLTFYGHQPSQAPVQFKATDNAESDGAGNVTIPIYPPLQAASGASQNINTDIVAGMQVKGVPNFRGGLVTAGNPLYVAMPKLPDQRPYDTAVSQDPDLGISTRMYTGALFGQNITGTVYDCFWGSTLLGEYAMAIIQPE